MFNSLEEKDLSVIIDAMGEVIVKTEEKIIEQGDDGDFLFIVETGTLDCFKKIGDDEPKKVKTCEAGDCFGELALLYNCPRAASVVAAEDAVLWKLDRETFNHIVKDSAAKKRDLYQEFLKKTALIKNDVDDYQISQIADALIPMQFEEGEVFTKEQENGDRFFLIEEGTAKVTKEGNQVMEYAAGDYFGELALMRNQPRIATVTATSAGRCLILDRSAFKRLLGPLEKIMMDNFGRYNLKE